MFYHSDQLLDILRKLMIFQIQIQICQQLLVNNRCQFEHLRADYRRLVTRTLAKNVFVLLFEVIKILHDDGICHLVIMVDKHFPQLNGVKVVSFLDRRNLLHDKLKPKITVLSMSNGQFLTQVFKNSL